MKKVSIYSSNFASKEEWDEFLDDLEFTAEEILEIEEVELRIKSSDVPGKTIEAKLY